MKRCSDCVSFSRPDGYDRCGVHRIVYNQWDAETCVDFAERDLPQCSRCAELETALRAVDAALENEFGGFYLSATAGFPMHNIREMLRGER